MSAVRPAGLPEADALPEARFWHLVEKIVKFTQAGAERYSPLFLSAAKRSDMEQQESGQRILDPIERAKLGLKVFNLPYSQAEELIDDYVSGKNYDQASIEYFKDQVATQVHIREKGAEFLVTGGEIIKLVVNSFIKNLPRA
jgi:hypothetical protein